MQPPSSLLSVLVHQELMTCGLAPVCCFSPLCVCEKLFPMAQAIRRRGLQRWVLLSPLCLSLSGFTVHKSDYDSRKWLSSTHRLKFSAFAFFPPPSVSLSPRPSFLLSVFLQRICKCLCVCLRKRDQAKPEREREGGRGAGVYAEGEGAVCVCVRSQGFDTAIQALWLPWCWLPYMAIGVKEQREWAV